MINLRTIFPSRKTIEFDIPDNRKEYLERYLEQISPNLKPRVNEVLEGRVKDFLTEPRAVNYIAKKCAYIDGAKNPWDLGYFCLVHLTNYFPENGIIIPSGEKSLMPRFTTHFCLNGCVTSHELGNWEESKYAIVLPVSGIEKKPYSFLPQDIMYVGRIRLPKGSFIIARNGVEIPKNSDLHVEKHPIKSGEEMRKIVHEKMFDRGYFPVRIGEWSWLSEPYRTITTYGKKVCHQLGPYIAGGYFPDESLRLETIGNMMEAEASDFHDAKNWTHLLEGEIFDKFKDIYDFNENKAKVEMSIEEFEKRFSFGLFGSFEHRDEETQKYLIDAIENYRVRMRYAVTGGKIK